MPTKTKPDAARRHAFDADERAKAREDAPITVGAAVYHRRRKTWEVTRALRALLRSQERANLRAEKLSQQVDALDADSDEDKLHDLEDQVDAAQDEAGEITFQIIELLLRDDDGGHPPVEHLKESLDAEDALALAISLSSGGEQAADPTEPTTAATETPSS